MVKFLDLKAVNERFRAELDAAAKRVFGIAPQEIFGSTETGGVAWRRQGGDNDESCDWTVFDPVEVGVNAEGRLVVSSPFSFQKGFVMGDGVELSPDGRHFRLLGRMDRIVKIAEQRVSLPEMEDRMKMLEGINDAALVAYNTISNWLSENKDYEMHITIACFNTDIYESYLKFI